MSEPSQNGNGKLTHGGEGGGVSVLSRSEMIALQKSAEKYPISNSDREEAVKWVMETGKVSKSLKTRLAAARTLAALDCVNLRRDEMEIQERHNDILESTVMIREGMKLPEVREALAKLSDQGCIPSNGQS